MFPMQQETLEVDSLLQINAPSGYSNGSSQFFQPGKTPPAENNNK